MVGRGDDVGGVFGGNVVAVNTAAVLGVGGKEVGAIHDVVGILHPAVRLQGVQIGDEGGGIGLVQHMGIQTVATFLVALIADGATLTVDIGRQPLQCLGVTADRDVNGHIIQLLDRLAFDDLNGGLGLGGGGGNGFGRATAAQQQRQKEETQNTLFHNNLRG